MRDSGCTSTLLMRVAVTLACHLACCMHIGTYHILYVQELGLKPRADERAQHMTLQSMPSAPAAMDSPASQGLPAETLASTAAHQHVWPQSDPSSLPGNPHLDAYLRSKSDTLSPYSHVFDNENTFPFASTPGLAPDLDDPAIASRLAELLSSMSTQMQGGPFTQDQ